MKMEFMEGKKSLHVHSCLLWERGRNKRLTQVLSWPSGFRQDFHEQHLHWGRSQKAAQRVHSDIIPQGPGMLPHCQGASTAQVDKASASSEGNF